jgi:hypothetical protein
VSVRSLLALMLLTGCGGSQLRITPDRGGQAGGTAIRIEGDDFVDHGPPVVYVGPRAAKAVVVESRWLITAMTPQSDDPGTVDVKVVFEDGTELDLPDAFAYEAQSGIVLTPEIGS